MSNSTRISGEGEDASSPAGIAGAPPAVDGFVLRLKRLNTERRPGAAFARTVSAYEAFYNRQKIAGLEGVAFERQGPGDNAGSGSKYHRRLAAGTYPLLTQDGSHYRTIGYQTNGEHPRPALLVGETGQRVAILVHPGSGYLSSIGCINLSKPLAGATDDISYGESQLRVTALINAMRMELGAAFPLRNGLRIAGGWLVIEGEPPNIESTNGRVLQSLLRNDPRERGLHPPLSSLSRQEVYELLAATMNGEGLRERVDLAMFDRLAGEIGDLGNLRDEFGRNLWSAWASGWQRVTTTAGADRSRQQADLQAIAQRLQRNTVDINDTQATTSPLIESAKANEWEAMRALRAMGADLTARDRHGDTPLTAAAFCGCHEAVAYLVAAGADQETKAGRPSAARSLASDHDPAPSETAGPPASEARQWAKRGAALHDGNTARLSEYARIGVALDQVRLGSVCHVWDYASRSCKESVDVLQMPGQMPATQGVHFRSKLQVDADGAPRAYHPQDRNPPSNDGKAFDWLANLASADRHGIQGVDGAVGPAHGFIISATSLMDERFAANDTRRYVDASTIPYVVLPKSKFPLPADLALRAGCVVCVVDTHTGGYSGAIFADIGRAVGEGSIRLAQRLGLSPFSSRRWPKVVGFDGADNTHRFLYLVFPQATVSAPWAVEEIQKLSDTLFAQWGGAERLAAIVPGMPPLKQPVTVFEEGPPPLPRGAAAVEPDGAEQRLRGVDGPKERMQQEQPTGPAASLVAVGLMAVGGAGVDRGPTAGKFEPDAHEREPARGADAVHPDEIDGPSDLPGEAEARVALPQVSWPSSDSEAPCYAHVAAAAGPSMIGNAPFDFTGEDLRLLCAANAFKPEGHGDRIVFALRGAMLQQGDSCKDVDHIALVETRPDHRNFRCVIGVFDMRAAKISAFKASTVPNAAYMTNYYKKVHAIRPYGETGANLLPTGCYVFRVGVHRNSIYPALRLTDPEKLAEDGKALVLRTSNDLTYRLDDLWDPCVPYDHVHCAYSYEAFSSAGCLTICGPNEAGPWGQFQEILKTVPRGNRLDVVLLTGREACLAAQFGQEHRGADAESVQAALARLRPGSQGERVHKLQTLLGLEASGYFGWRTKQALIERQRQSGLGCDGIYAPALDQRLGWDVFNFPSGATSLVAARSAASAHAGASLIKPVPAELGQFAPRAFPEYLRVLLEEGPAELERCGINTNPLRFCHFMAQIAHESAGFSIRCESLNYQTVGRLRAVWPNRFPDDASARPYLGNEQMLAEKVYGGRLGNTQKGDAYRYRGRGFVQTTGRDAYREMGNKLQLPLEDNPDLLLDPLVALKAACRTWADNAHPGERSMNTLADGNKLEALTYRINGGYTNLGGRRTEFRKAWHIWGKGDPPVGQVEPEVIDRGDRGDLVVKLTRSLGELGYYQGRPDHIFGVKAYASVRNFQARQGLPASGVVDQETWDAIERVLLGSRGEVRGRRAVAGAPRGDAAVLVRRMRRAALAVALLAVGCIGLFFVARVSGAALPSPLLWLAWTFAACALSALLGMWAATRYLRQPPPHDAADAAVLAAGAAEQEPVRSGTALAGETAASGGAENP